MDLPKKGLTRREFIAAAGTVGAVSLMPKIGSAREIDSLAGAMKTGVRVPKRPFGRTGVEVSTLALGGMFDIPNSQLLLKQAVRWGVTYWDTADCYGGGVSEKGIGKYFSNNPGDREKIFLVSKSDARDPDGMTRLLNRSLERMNTNYVDLYFVHGIRRLRELDTQTRRWAEQAKADGKIRLFGFSTHSNMEECLVQAAPLGWIDGIMMTYNFRLMHTPRMVEAIRDCQAAGIGLTAMKTQGGGQVRTDTQIELDQAGRFLEKGFTDKQARLKAVWENPAIASICSQMPNLTILMSNVAAATDRVRLSSRDVQLFEQLARETETDYCAGCADVCESLAGGSLPIADVMRFLMYSRSYGETGRARTHYRQIPRNVRDSLVRADFSSAERGCPRHLAIGRLMREAENELG